MLRSLSLVVFMLLLQASFINTAIADKTQPYISHLDMYGTSGQLADKLMKKYDKQLRTLYQEITKVMLSDPEKPNYLENYDLAKQLSDSIKNDLMKEGYFSLINISSIFYPDDKNLYITLDVVDKNDNEIRNNFSQPPSKTIEDKSGLVTAWLAYEEKGWELFQQGKVSLELTNCPAYHCTFGFDNEALKNYLSKFDTAEKHEKELVDILTNDADPEKRATVPFLIGHFANPEKIIELLTPSLDDPDNGVRNNALRVIISTVLKVEDPDLPVQHIPAVDEPGDGVRNDALRVSASTVLKAEDPDLAVPVKKIVKAINDPTAADRAKALIILYEVVKKDKKYHQYIKTNAGQILINLLKLKQPGNHMGAYMVLKEISGENYDQWDIASWEKWVGNS